jgi:hypothetical protein
MVEELRGRIPTEVHYERMANLRMEPPDRASADPEDPESLTEEEGEALEGPSLPTEPRPEPEGPGEPE